MFKLILTLFLVLITTIAVTIIAENPNKSKLIFSSEVFDGDSCVTVRNGIEVNGTCMEIEKCTSVLENIMKRIYNHTVCGYEGTKQIICCPSNVNTRSKIPMVVKINFYDNLECQLPESNATGVLKFLSECPAFNKSNVAAYSNRICDYEICADLVCCPATSKTRLKKVCWMVDLPLDTLEVRLLRNQECTIKELNLKGIYQQECDFADRNPHLKSILHNVCNDHICNNWYCCPIEDIDNFFCTAKSISSSLARLVGPKCVDSKTGRQGTCKRSYDCQYMNFESIPFQATLDLCGSYCCSDFYCCPDDDGGSDNQPISTRECTSYTKYLYKEEIEVPMDAFVNKTICGGSGFAAGGIVVSPGDFPHMAALGYKPGETIIWSCGGSLISDRFVLTAAHCLTNREIGDVKKVRLGVIDLLLDVNTHDCPEEFDVAQRIPHSDYNHKYVYNDIGLIQLVGRVKFNFHILPICLPTSPDIPEFYQSMGWGALGEAEDKSVKLIKVNQDLFSYEECQEQYQYVANRRFNRGILNDTHICAGSKDSIQSTCVGDSGGPLLARHEVHHQLFVIYGIVSFGTACGFANSAGIYTKVFPYVNWIEGIVWGN